MCTDVAITLVFGIVDGVVPLNRSQCTTRHAIFDSLFIIQFITSVALRPYNVKLMIAFLNDEPESTLAHKSSQVRFRFIAARCGSG